MSREALSLPPDCALRKDFPGGEVYVQMSGVENYEGSAHVSLYDTPWESVPRTPTMHLKLPMGTSAEYYVRAALKAEHDDILSESECGCIALDSLRAIARRHQEAVST